MAELRGGLVGCGFWARNHLHAWREVSGAEIVALCDLVGERARTYAGEFAVAKAYTDLEAMLETESLDFVDVVTHPDAHRAAVEAVAASGLHVICQKPLAPSLEDAKAMVAACDAAGVQSMVHENFRWQAPMRALKEAAAGLDDPFFCRVSFRSGVDVYTAQPYLATDPRFILYDMGVHLLDLARFFVGEAEYLTCHTQRVNPRIRGEDVATVLLRMAGGATCCVEMSFASTLEEDLFPQTLVHLETGDSSATLGSHYRLTVTDDEGTRNVKLDLPGSDWMEPGFEVVQGSVVATQQHWADCLHTDREPETTGRDNLRTLELVFGAYESAETGEVYRVGTAK